MSVMWDWGECACRHGPACFLWVLKLAGLAFFGSFLPPPILPFNFSWVGKGLNYKIQVWVPWSIKKSIGSFSGAVFYLHVGLGASLCGKYQSTYKTTLTCTHSSRFHFQMAGCSLISELLIVLFLPLFILLAFTASCGT